MATLRVPPRPAFGRSALLRATPKPNTFTLAASASSLSRLRHMNMKRLSRLWSPTGVPTLDEEEEFGEVDDLLSV